MLFRRLNWNIVGWFKTVSAISYLIIGLGFAGAIYHGFEGGQGFQLKHTLRLGLSFTGGTDIAVTFDKPTTTPAVLAALAPLNLQDERINTAQAAGAVAGTQYVIETQTSFANDSVPLKNALKTVGSFDPSKLSITAIGASLGSEYLKDALLALIIALGIQFLYIAFRFGWNYIFGLVTVIALVRDAAMMIGIYALAGRPADDAFLAAVLTVIGYSVMDTIVILDRIRENTKIMVGVPYDTIVNDSIKQTMTRSFNTLATVVITLVALLALGGASLQNFAFALLVGICSGGYHSIFFSAPLVLVFRKRQMEAAARKLRTSASHGDHSTSPSPARSGVSRDDIVAARRDRRAKQKSLRTPDTSPVRYKKKTNVAEIDPLDAQESGLHDAAFDEGHEEINLNLGEVEDKRPLPPPTRSEAAFERAFELLVSGEPVLRQAQDDTVDAFVESVFAKAKEYADDRYASIGGASQFHTKLAGVSFEGRQDTIAGLVVGSELALERQADNPYDVNAIAVRFGTLQLGFISRGIAKHLAPLIDEGARYRARVESLTGGGERHRGVNVYVWRDAAASLAARPSTSLRYARDDKGEVEAAVRRALIGEAVPHEAQLRALERIEAGRNTLVVLGTGRGKSFCFQYPAAVRALTSGAKTLVMYPLRALANDQYEALLRRFETLGLRIYRANGSISHDEREELFEALHSGAWDIVLATPEFLEYHRAEFTGKSAPSLVVVDEAHHLYESKHRAAYGRLGETIASLGTAQVLALTATANDESFATIRRDLCIESWIIDPTVRENLHVIDARGNKDKTTYLLDLFGDGAKGIVYCNSRKEASKLAESLRKKLGNTVMFYHAGMPTPDRHDVERYFREGALRVVVATSAFGEGIDLPDVRHVVLYHLNFDFTEFNQQSGRAGRDGAPAEIHLLFGESDRRINEFIIDRDAPTLPVLRELYKGIKALATDGYVRSTYVDIARTLELDRVNERSVSRALHTFEDEGLVEIAQDDEGRYVRFLPVERKVDLEANERFAEGEAERESFKKFCALALTAKADALERIINRPIYPQMVELVR